MPPRLSSHCATSSWLSETEEDGGEATARVSAELDESRPAAEVEPNEEMTAEGYDEAVEKGVPFRPSQKSLRRGFRRSGGAYRSRAVPADELLLQEAGRDLRPDMITPSPDITSTAVADFEANIREERG